MPSFEAVEIDVQRDDEGVPLLPGKETGLVEYYLADSIEEAVSHCCYTRSLKNQRVSVGPSGRVVYSGNLCYALRPAT